MAKANAKKVSTANASLLQILLLSLVVSNALHLVSLFVFPASRRPLLYSFSSLFTLSAYMSLASSSRPTKDANGRIVSGGDDLGQGLWQYVVDGCFVSCAVWVLSGWVARGFWWLYLVIPLFGTYKLAVLAAPFVLPRLGFGSPPAGNRPDAQAAPAQSKRQQKLEARQQAQLNARKPRR